VHATIGSLTVTARIAQSVLLSTSLLLVLPAAADLQVPLTTPAAHKAAADPAKGRTNKPQPVKPIAPPDPIRKALAARGSLASRSMPASSYHPFVRTDRDMDIPALPAVGGSIPTEAPPEKAVQAWLGKILSPTVELYRMPDAHSTWVARLKAGQDVAIVSQWQGWFAILMNDGSQAYVPQAYVEVQPFQVKSVEAPAAPSPAPTTEIAPRVQPSSPGGAASPGAQAVIQAALSYLDVPYVYGGNSAKGIDCSGLVKACFGACGVQLPRQAHLQAEVGQPVPFDQLQPGDRLYFSVKKQYDHTGIYLGSGNFIHASMSRHKVAVDNLSTPLYGEHLAAARR
jgi:cell wall-associated NlpC family hydrolase